MDIKHCLMLPRSLVLYQCHYHPFNLKISHFLFHFIFTTNESSVSQLVQGTKQCGFNWRHMRSIESIFHHHPTSEVIVHSRTLPHDTFDVFTEAGYSIKVQNYDLEKLLKGSPAESFAS